MNARDDRISLTDLAATLRAGRRSIVAFTALVVGVLLSLTLAARMQFRANGSIYLGEVEGKSGFHTTLPEQVDFLSGGNGEIGTEVEILQSRDLIRRAVSESGLNATIVPLGWSPPRYWAWRLTHRDFRLLDRGYRNVDVTNAALTDGFATEPIAFTVSFLHGGAYQVSRDNAVIGSGALGQEFVSSVAKMTLQAGSDGPPTAGAVFTLTVSPLEAVADAVSKKLTITTPKSVGPNEPVRIVSIEFVHPSPRAALSLLATLMRLYLDRHQAWKSEEATAAEAFVMSQVQAVKQSLDMAEQKLAEFKKNSSVVVLGDEAKGMIEQLGQYEQQRVAAQLQVESFSQMEGALKGRNTSLEQYMIGDAHDPVLAELSSKVAQAQQDLQGLRERFTDDAPGIHEQRAQVNSQLGMLKSYVQSRHARAQQQLDALERMISQFDDKLKTVPGAELELAQLTRDTEVLGKMYAFLLERQQQAMVAKASNISRNHILDAPRVPSHEDTPALGLRLIAGLFIGLLLGSVVVIFRRTMGDTFQTPHELKKNLGALPVYASVPRWRRINQLQSTRPGALGSGPPGLLSSDDPASPFSEAFRHLRTNIYYSESGISSRVVLITSPCPGDGKTLCTLSLAAALVADKKRVLVIEGDMHRPTHHRLLNQSKELGLSSLLTRTDIIRTIESQGGTFDAVVAGTVPPSPADLLSSPQFGGLVNYGRDSYDFVLIDSPPFPLVSDAFIIARHVDHVITVVRPQNTRRDATDEHLRGLSASARKHSLIINDIDASNTSGVPYGYGYHSRNGEEPLASPGLLGRFRRRVAGK